MTGLGGTPRANTVVKDAAGNQIPGIGQVSKLRYDWDFIVGESKPFKNPAAVVTAEGNPDGLLDPLATDADNSFSVFSPVTREIVGKSSERIQAEIVFADPASVNPPDPDLLVTDVQGNPAQWGKYVSPNGIGHPEMGEIDLSRSSSPFVFEGIPWNLDRRLGPVGGDEAVAVDPLGAFPLEPFPTSGLTPDQFLNQPVPAEQVNRPTNIHDVVTVDLVTGVTLDHRDPPVPNDFALSSTAAAEAQGVLVAAPVLLADVLTAAAARAQQELDDQAAIAAFNLANPPLPAVPPVSVTTGGPGAAGQTGTGVGLTRTIAASRLSDQ